MHRPTPAAEAARRTQPDYIFDFCGGHLAVDFTNTIGNRGDPSKQDEHFRSFGDVLAWAEAAGVLSRRRAGDLRAEASRHPEAARAVYRRALDLREALYRLLAARARKRPSPPADLETFNRDVGDVYSSAALVPSRGGFALDTPSGEGVDAVLRAVVRSAIDLLTSPAESRLGMCADETCAWLFIDAIRSGTRRWCDMKSCGNRNKVRRFRKSS